MKVKIYFLGIKYFDNKHKLLIIFVAIKVLLKTNFYNSFNVVLFKPVYYRQVNGCLLSMC